MINQKPRKAYYLLAHEAFRLMAENNPEQFFQLMASEHQSEVINQLIAKVDSLCAEEPCDITSEDVAVKLTQINHLPTILLSLPEPKGYVECFYVAIIGLFAADKTEQSKTDDSKANQQIAYFTIELAESEHNQQQTCASFCQWQGDTHFNLAELELGCTLESFELLLGQRLSE
jgi:hypothetical protein